jgi:hypothetical protein
MTEKNSENDDVLDMKDGLKDPQLATAQKAPVNINLEHIVGPPLEDLQRESLSRLRIVAMTSRVIDLVPDESEVHITFTGDFPASVMSRALPGAGEENYNMGRGASYVAGRTMRRSDGGFDLLFDASNLFSIEGDTDEEIEALTSNVMHCASHEPQHVWLAHTETESANYNDLVKVGPTEFMFRKAVAGAMDEYRCERAANAFEPTQPPKTSTISRDIDHLRQELNASRAICATDTGRASYQALSAANLFLTALAYLLAELPTYSAGSTPPEPDELPEGWLTYVEPVWPILWQTFSLVPPANELTTAAHLAVVAGMLCQVHVVWLDMIGIQVTADHVGGDTCFWTNDIY